MRRKITLLILIAVTTAVTFVSCSKNDNYSCDPEINLWTKSNMNIIKTMTRSSLLKIDNDDRQRSVFSALSSTQKHDLWVEKINEVMKLDWNQAEMEHLGALITMINNNSDWFDADLTTNEVKKDEFDLLTYQWIDYAKENLKWSDKLIYGIVRTPKKLMNKEGDILQRATSSTASSVKITREGGGGTSPRGCYCIVSSYEYGCQGACRSNGCEKVLACGFMMLETCTGQC